MPYYYNSKDASPNALALPFHYMSAFFAMSSKKGQYRKVIKSGIRVQETVTTVTN